MKKYKKPIVLSQNKRTGIAPLAAAVGAAFAKGVAAGLMKDSKTNLSKVPAIEKVLTV
jgi:hypothetical protein